MISKDTKLHLNYTIYFDSEGYECSSLAEARDNSLDSSSITVVKKQNVYFYEYEELSDDLKEDAEAIVEGFDEDYSAEDMMYILNSKCNRIVLVTTWDALQEALDQGVYTIVA
jgi:hypothetical protein